MCRYYPRIISIILPFHFSVCRPSFWLSWSTAPCTSSTTEPSSGSPTPPPHLTLRPSILSQLCYSFNWPGSWLNFKKCLQTTLATLFARLAAERAGSVTRRVLQPTPGMKHSERGKGKGTPPSCLAFNICKLSLRRHDVIRLKRQVWHGDCFFTCFS